MDHYRVIADHDADGREPLQLRAGQRTRFERRATEWEGWLWCIDESGNGGWVPEAWLALDGRQRSAILRRDYCSRELTVRRGAVVTGSLVESGWLWATTPAGRSGWVPLRVLQRDAGGSAG